jgi:hypothetical protein
MDNKPNFSREVKLQWAGSRERNLASGRGRTFFLTFLFIERFDPATWILSAIEIYRQLAVFPLLMFRAEEYIASDLLND